MTDAEHRLLSLLAERDAPAQDDVFVSSVMARIAPRAAALPSVLRPLARIAPLLALATVAPLLIEGLRTVLAASDPQVVAVSLALALTCWLTLGAFARGSRPLLST